ncbi:MAG: NINE protein [Oscillospiraceae bacterium]
MYCRHCGAEMNSDALICPSCGVSAGSGSTYCANCGAESQPGAVFCSHCGCQFAPEQAQQTYYQDPAQQSYQSQPSPDATPNYQAPNYQAPNYQAPGQGYQPPVYQPAGTPLKSKMAAGLLGIFLGAFGVHNFYLGYTTKAVIQLCLTLLSCGVLSFVSGIWGFIEGVLLLTGSINVDGNGMPLQQ